MKNRSWFNLPNILTAIRILLVPAFLLTFFKSPANKQLPSLCVFLAAGATDCLDGFFARRFNLVTALGKVLDPVADKLMCAAVLFCLSWSGVLPCFVLPIIIVKELYMAVGTGICLKRKIEVESDIYGKLATGLFYPAILLIWPWHELTVVENIGHVLTYISLTLSIVAAVHYTLSSVKIWKARKAN